MIKIARSTVKKTWEEDPGFRPMSRTGTIIRNTLKVPRSPGPVPWRTHGMVRRAADRLVARAAMAADIRAWAGEVEGDLERIFLHLEEYGESQGPSLEAALEAASISEAAMYLALTTSSLKDEEAREDTLLGAGVALEAGIIHGKIRNSVSIHVSNS